MKDKIMVMEQKPPIIKQQCNVRQFKCDLCDEDHVECLHQHLHQCIEEHKGLVLGCHIMTCNYELDDIVTNFRI